MSIIVCPLSRAPEIAREHRPSRVVSLLDPYSRFPRLDGHDHNSHLCVEVHDINEETEGMDAVCDQRIRRILDFVTGWERAAPILITAAGVANMQPGSVIIDLAGESGGNCELTKAGETVVSDNGVKIIAPRNLPSDMAAHASQLYAKNLENFIGLIVDDEGNLAVDFDDEVVAGACLTDGGEIKNERAKSVVEGS